LTATLCKRCSDVMRIRKIVKKLSDGAEVRTDYCQNCKTHTFVGIYDIQPKRKEERYGKRISG
jgi:hypothetical protein